VDPTGERVRDVVLDKSGADVLRLVERPDPLPNPWGMLGFHTGRRQDAPP
jgi:hypothetical protein